MEVPRCRLLPFLVADGPGQMAADQTLLESAVAGTASLRFYAWSEATLSLGYFQTEKERRQNPRLAALPFVRRPSGGAALVHHHELTYALALPPGPLWQRGGPWLRRMHEIIAAALGRLGVSVELAPEKKNHSTSLLCFRQLTPDDLCIGGAKVVGSAQRKQRGALLQHGGILLASSSFTPELPGIRELSGRTLSAEETRNAVRNEFSRQTGGEWVEADWTEAERRRIEELRSGRYDGDEWNRKR